MVSRRLASLSGCFLLVAALAAAQPCSAQEDSQDFPEKPAAQPTSAVAAPQGSAERKVSWKLLGPNLLHDQKRIWLFPVAASGGRHLEGTLAVVGVTTGLVVLDPRVARTFRGTRAFDTFNRAFTGGNTWLGTEAVLPAVYVIGLVRQDSYAQHTALLGAEAFLDANVVSVAMEDGTHRLLPFQVPLNGNLSDTWFNYSRHGRYLRGAGGFPSGHTISAFAIATVIADRYPNPSWHRWVAYGLAGAVGFSRMSVQAHFPSDVFLGAALGYAIPHFMVLRPSRSTPENLDAP
jgi:membrane-associated phospholipid phosphatase